MRQRNERLRQARLALRAPDGSASPMSRQELAEAVNAQVAAATGRPGVMSGGHVGKLEQGRYCWPRRHYREAF
ncbi:MAG: hypothetical protein JXA67_10985, partial [Micromonosporaceae bacterium]|nr:hypothetical protein [Micromonosporaceae bacterium]